MVTGPRGAYCARCNTLENHIIAPPGGRGGCSVLGQNPCRAPRGVPKWGALAISLNCPCHSEHFETTQARASMVRVQCPHGALAAPAPHSLHRPLSALRAFCAFRSTNVCSGLFLPDWLGLRTSGPYGARRASWSGVPPLPGANQLAPLAPQLRLRCGPYVEKRGPGAGGGGRFFASHSRRGPKHVAGATTCQRA